MTSEDSSAANRVADIARRAAHTAAAAAASATSPDPAAAPDAAPGTGKAAAAATGKAAGAAASHVADLVAPPGGVMTDEVGVVTGDLTLRSEYADGKVTLRIQYKDADEWYVVTGGSVPLHDPADLEAVHTIALALLNRPEG